MFSTSMASKYFIVASVVMVLLCSTAEAQFVPAVPYDWAAELEMQDAAGLLPPISGNYFSSYLNGMSRFDARDDGIQYTTIKRNNTVRDKAQGLGFSSSIFTPTRKILSQFQKYEMEDDVCTKITHDYPLVSPFWWTGLATFEGIDQSHLCSKYLVNLDHLSFFNGTTQYVEGCFFTARVPAYVVHARKRRIIWKYKFLTYQQDPQDPDIFDLPANCEQDALKYSTSKIATQTGNRHLSKDLASLDTLF